MILFSISI